MAIVRATEKGQVIIPAHLRKKHNIKKGSRVNIYEGEGGVIIVKPLPDNPIEYFCGIFKDGSSLTDALLRERKEDLKREEQKCN